MPDGGAPGPAHPRAPPRRDRAAREARLIRRFQTFPDFFDGAEELRRLIDEHFAHPFEQTELTHGVWNYWFVPDRYNFLRAAPERLLGAAFDRFSRRLTEWSIAELGLTGVGAPSLNLYVNGCSQGLHSDFQNGIWGYVFSLTRFRERRFAGGETLLLKDGAHNYRRHHVSGELLYDLVPPEFNQLLVFDDRIVHGVTPLAGTMDPREGRIVLVGHIYGGVPVIEGPLDRDALRTALDSSSRELQRDIAAARDVQGMMVVRLTVQPSGALESPEVLFNNLVSARADGGSVGAVAEAVLARLTSLRLPPSSGPGRLTVPVLVPIVVAPPILVERTHALSVAEVRRRIEAFLASVEARALLDGRWVGDVRYEIRCPGPGVIEIAGDRVRAALEPAVVNPGQWTRLAETLERELTAGLR